MNARHLIASTIVAATLAATPKAFAEESVQGPAYVQGAVGINFWDFPNVRFFGIFPGSYSWTGFRPEVEFGYHFSGRHDGFVLGVRQAFFVTALGYNGDAAGATLLRAGYDIPFKAGSMEVNVDPFAAIGVGYIFDGPHAGIAFTGGVEVKLFVTQGVYVMGKPVELGVQCFHDVGYCAFNYAAGVGAGFAFGK